MLSDVALEVAKEIGRANPDGTAILDLETEIKEQIRETIRFYNRKPFHLTEWRDASVVLVSGTAWYSTASTTGGAGAAQAQTSVPVSDIISIRDMREADSLKSEIYQVPFRDFQCLSTGTSPGTGVSYFTLYAEQIGFYPTPSASQTVNFSGNIKGFVPVANTDTSVWFDEAKELIVTGAVARMCSKYTHDFERAQIKRAEEGLLAVELHSEYIRKRATGRIVPHD